MTTVERDGHSEAAVGIALAGDRWQTGVLHSVVMALPGVALLVKGDVLLGGLIAAVSGLAAIGPLRRRDARVWLLLGEGAVVSRSPVGAVAVPWEAVTEVGQRAVSGARYLEIVHDGRARRGLLLRVARRLGIGPRDRLWIALERLDADPDVLVAAIARLHEDPAERRRIATGELAGALGAHANLTPASPR
jgi:hypothetical protein